MESHKIKLFQFFLDEALFPFESAACLTKEGDLLKVKYETLADIGTLGNSTSTVIKYFPLKSGDAVLLNDPYSGGTTLSMMTIVTPLLLNHQQIPDLYLAVRTGFRPQLIISKSLEEEGLRVPPTPIAQNRKLNSVILNAMGQHPLCPRDLEKRLHQILEKIWKRVDCFQTLLEKNSDFFHRQSIKFFLKQSRNYLETILHELPQGEALISVKTEAGDLIKLKLELSHENIHIDFSGTSASKRICLTDSATFGACFGAIATFLEKPIPMNSGSFSLLQVSSPAGCLLNAKYPAPTYKGMTEGTSLIASVVTQALSSIIPQKKFSFSAQTSTQISFDFENKSHFFDSLPAGSSASESKDGTDAVLFWTRNHLRNSIQEIESQFPLLIQSIALRHNSGGHGPFKGGCGLVKNYLLNSNATLHWLVPRKNANPKGAKGGASGQAPEIKIVFASSGLETFLTQEEGQLSLSKGDKITVSSAGGAAYGKF